MDQGIAMIHQELHPVRPQTVAENIFLGRIPYKKVAGVHWVDKERLIKDTEDVFKKLGLDINPKQKVAELSTSYCQLIEIARSVSIGAKIVIMDEPLPLLQRLRQRFVPYHQSAKKRKRSNYLYFS